MILGRFLETITGHFDDELAEKTQLVTAAALDQVDESLPIVTALLAGKRVAVTMEIKLMEVDDG